MGENVQIILADDGSDDCSYEICKNYAEKHENVVLLQEKNQGPSAARNLALSAATGEYVVFCDADDQLETSLADTLRQLRNRDYDLIQFGVISETGHESIRPDLLYPQNKELDQDGKKELLALTVGLRDQRNVSHGYFGLVTCKVYKRSLLEGLRFDPTIVGEDTLYTVQALKRAKRVLFLAEHLYHYQIMDGTYSHRYFPNILPMAAKMVCELRNEVDLNDPLLKKAFYDHAYDKLWWSINASIPKDCRTVTGISAVITDVARENIFKETLRNKQLSEMNFKEKIKFYFLRFGMTYFLAAVILRSLSKEK